MLQESEFVNLKAKEIGRKFISDMREEQPEIFDVLVKGFDCLPIQVNADYFRHLSYSLSFPETVTKKFTKEQMKFVRERLYQMVTSEIVMDMMKTDTNYFTIDFYDYLTEHNLIDY